ncbi:class I SAM-dependent methyltransferase family protein [Haloarculaceae archaeon H-GB1-1]|nr:class I SAM-dependent methyltransferase family protein [Haloarculaceae archaeon H-GB1-1]
MEVPCVRVAREDGERTRRALADDDLVAEDYEIIVDDGWLYVPVTDTGAVPPEFSVVDREVPTRSTQTTPTDILGFEPSYARLGDVVIIDEDDADRADEIAAAVVESDLPVETVINRASKVQGELRIRDWDVIAEPDDATQDSPATETVHREYGCEYVLDLAEVYFSPRLATERHRVAEQVSAGEHAFDMFAGVGPFAIPFAKRDAEVVAVDLNEIAIEYLRRNAERNAVADRITAIQGDVRDVAAEYEGWADRIVMNLPHSADEFLDSAVALAGDDCVIHYYDIQHEDDPFGPGLDAIRAAAEPEYDVEVLTEHVVRSYAPHELNVCLDVRLTA